jgi:hypothetical protein
MLQKNTWEEWNKTTEMAGGFILMFICISETFYIGVHGFKFSIILFPLHLPYKCPISETFYIGVHGFKFSIILFPIHLPYTVKSLWCITHKNLEDS